MSKVSQPRTDVIAELGKQLRFGTKKTLARRYVGELLRFQVDDRAREAVDAFLARAGALGLLPESRSRWTDL